jgi:beta-lactamase class A
MYFYWGWLKPEKVKNADSDAQHSIGMLQFGNNDFRYIKPLRLVDLREESENYTVLKQEINLLIQDKLNQGLINRVSVYFRVMNDGQWISINGNTSYRAGSLMKVPVMIYYLKQAEKNPSLLNQTRVYKKTNRVIPDQTYPDKTIIIGKPYTIKELIGSMIMYSDNYATSLLNNSINTDGLSKLFTDLGIKKPALTDINYSITAIDYSRFLQVLYSSTYLGPESSEFALTQMAGCSFKEGLLKKIPENIVVAHKFGEANDMNNTELSESGLFYIGNNPYLLTVMVNGKELSQDADLISDISYLVYKQMKQ